MNQYPAKFKNLFSKIDRKNGYYELNLKSSQIDLVLDLLRLDKDYQEHLFDCLFKAYRIEHPNYMEPLALKQFKNFIYRGQKDYEWELTPGSLRNFDKHKSSYTDFELESILNFMKCTDELNLQIPSDSIELRKDFKNLLDDNGLDASNNWQVEKFHEVLAFAQHYGASTRLLDWSYSPLVSLYFASIGLLMSEKHPKYFSIYILNTDYLSLKNPKKDLVEIVNVPKGLNRHISLQKGCFTLNSQVSYRNKSTSILVREHLGIECETKPVLIPDILHENERDYCLLKINFPAITAKQIFKYCNSMGINASSIYEPGEALKKRIEEMNYL